MSHFGDRKLLMEKDGTLEKNCFCPKLAMRDLKIGCAESEMEMILERMFARVRPRWAGDVCKLT